MDLNRKTPIAGLSLAVIMCLALPMQAEAGNRQFKNTVGGAVIGAGVGSLVGGSSGARAGAVVGG